MTLTCRRESVAWRPESEQACDMHSPLHQAALPLPQACPGTVYMPAVRARLLCMAACDQQVALAPAPTLPKTTQQCSGSLLQWPPVAAPRPKEVPPVPRKQSTGCHKVPA